MRKLLLALAVLSSSAALAQGFLRGTTAVLHSPFYVAYQPKAIPGAPARIGVLPVRLQHEAAKRILEKTRAQVLLDSLTGFLNKQPQLRPVALPAEVKVNSLPDIYFGTVKDLPGQLPGFVQALSCPNAGYGCVQLAGWPGQGKTRQALVTLMQSQQLDYLLVPMLREANVYFSQKVKKFGPITSGSASAVDYYLDEGSGHVVHFQHLNDLNGTAGLLVLTGALLDAKGNLVLVGAEGLKDLGVGFQPARMVTLEAYQAQASDYEALLRPLRRDDLPGQPAAWQEAARQLSQRLTGRQLYQEDSPYQFLMVPANGGR